uniref:Transposase n=1 Tax=Knipowitschia caucasica TaxID=637954 RepID=A0AAV2LKJ4_KNICA
MKIGGRRAFVVIDESMFRHKRKYNRGRIGRTWRRRNAWVFGMLEVDRHRRRPVLKLVLMVSKEMGMTPPEFQAGMTLQRFSWVLKKFLDDNALEPTCQLHPATASRQNNNNEHKKKGKL